MVEGARPGILTDRIYALAVLKICLVYLVFGILWILFSDNLLLPLASRKEDMILVSSVKGILFIVVTTVLLFFLIRYYSRQLRDANTQLRVQYDALVLSQEEWESTFNAISDWISLITPEGQVLRSNNAVERLFGVPAGAIVGRHCFELIHGKECLAHACPRRRMLISRRREITEIPVRDGTGDRRPGYQRRRGYSECRPYRAGYHRTLAFGKSPGTGKEETACPELRDLQRYPEYDLHRCRIPAAGKKNAE